MPDSRRHLKLLMISAAPILPPDSGGRIRVYELARHLSQLGIDVTVLTSAARKRPRKAKSEDGFKLKVISGYPFLLVRFRTFFPSPFPFLYSVSFHPGLNFLLSQFLKSFDIYQFEGPEFAGLLQSIPKGRPIIYDAHNVQYDYVRQECRWSFVRELVGRRIFRLEKKLMEASTHVFSCSKRDMDRFKELYRITPPGFFYIPNGIRQIIPDKKTSSDVLQEPTFPQLRRFKRQAIFSGSDIAHCHSAVQFILRDLAPRLKDECAFIIHGLCGRRFKKNNQPNVFIDLDYRQFEKYATSRTVALNPITQGSGTNLKVLYYLAHRLPVVSTEFGMRGFDDLKKFVSVAPLEDFHKSVLHPKKVHPGVDSLLKRYLWRSSAEKIKELYYSAVQNGNP